MVLQLAGFNGMGRRVRCRYDVIGKPSRFFCVIAGDNTRKHFGLNIVLRGRTKWFPAMWVKNILNEV